MYVNPEREKKCKSAGVGLKIELEDGGGSAKSGGFFGSGSLEAGGKKGAGLGVGEGDELEGASGAGDFAEDAFGDEVIDMFGDGGDGGETEGGHDFAVTRRNAMGGEVVVQKFDNKRLFFGKFGWHML